MLWKTRMLAPGAASKLPLRVLLGASPSGRRAGASEAPVSQPGGRVSRAGCCCPGEGGGSGDSWAGEGILTFRIWCLTGRHRQRRLVILVRHNSGFLAEGFRPGRLGDDGATHLDYLTGELRLGKRETDEKHRFRPDTTHNLFGKLKCARMMCLK